MAWPGLVWSVLKGLKMLGAINPTCLWIGLDGIGISPDRSISRSPDGDNKLKEFDSYILLFMCDIGISKCQDMVPNIKIPSKTKVAPPH